MKIGSQNKWIKLFIQIIFFIVLSIWFVYPLQKNGIIYFGDDMKYHVNRILELINNLRNGNVYPYIYTYTFDKIGYPLGIFYPWVTLLPFAFFSIVLKSTVNGIYAGFAFYTFLTLVFMYICVKKMNKSKFQANIAAIMYAFCAYRTIDAFSRFALGEFLAMVFLPLCLYGMYAILFGDKKDWPFLAFGMSFTLLSHVLSTFIFTLALLTIFLIFIWFVEDKINTIVSLLKAGILAISSSAIFLFPFIEQEMFQKFNPPSPMDITSTANYMDQIVQASLRNSVLRSTSGIAYGIGITLFMVIIVGIVFFERFDLTSKTIYLLGIISFVITSTIFPWNLFKNTPVSLIQFPMRILVLTSVFLSYSGSDIIELMLSSINSMTRKKLFKISMILLILIPWFSSISQFKKASQSNGEIYNGSLVENYNGSLKEYRYGIAWYLDQYTPKKSMPSYKEIENHLAIIDGKKEKITSIYSKPNELIYKNLKIKAGEKVDLPISIYKNLHVYQAGKELKLINSKRNTVAFRTNSNKSVVVKYVPSIIDRLGILLTSMAWIISLAAVIYKRVKYKARRGTVSCQSNT